MFTISAKAVYGLAAVVDLAAGYETGPIQIKDIAEAHAIPQHYLEQILVILKKAGLVDSRRGAQGGYVLAARPADIAVSAVLTALEGRLEVIGAKHQTDDLAFFWDEISTALTSQLAVSVETLVRRRAAVHNALNYSI